MIASGKVVTLWEIMERFAADDLWEVSKLLTEWSRDSGSLDDVLPSQFGRYGDAVAKLSEYCTSLALSVTRSELDKIHSWYHECDEDIKKIEDRDQRNGALTGLLKELGGRLDHICSVVHSELNSRYFFHLAPERAKFYDQKELFGKEVNTKFSAIQYDMVEAGNCYAVGRGTACVFHLMRIMEVGVQAFGSKLGVVLVNEKNWQNILEEINKAIKTLPPKAAATVEMTQASANLYSVKLAWRNEVMHPNDTYTLEEAEDLIRQVKTFMRQLAKII